MKYKIVAEASASDLNHYVNYYLDRGWELYGSPFTRNELLCQALVSREVKPSRKPKEVTLGCF